MLTKKFFRTVKQYAAQFISMTIMIAIGTGVFLGFSIEWQTIRMNADKHFGETKYADYRLYSAEGFGPDDIDKISKIDGIKAATRFLSFNADLEGDDKSLAIAVSEDYNVSIMHITEGNPYSDSIKGIWLSDRFAAENGIKVGDTLKLKYGNISIDQKVEGLAKSGEFTICTGSQAQLMPDYKVFGFAYTTPSVISDIMHGHEIYNSVYILSDGSKNEIKKAVSSALSRDVLVSPKSDHISFSGVESEIEEGKTMSSVLPVFFLMIAVLTMITTMHRISANEKTQCGTLMALGFSDRKILLHYSMYGFIISSIGTILGVLLGFLLAYVIIEPSGTMAVYLDFPAWKLSMPSFCIPLLIALIAFITLSGAFSFRKMLSGTPSEVLKPYSPKKMKRLLLEGTRVFKSLSFGAKWNLRDIFRHKSRSFMTVIGVTGCMILLVAGLGMRDSLKSFIATLNYDISNYNTKLEISAGYDNSEALALAESLDGEASSLAAVEIEGEVASLEVYDTSKDKIRFIGQECEQIDIKSDGAYLCLRLANERSVGDTVTFSPYGSDKKYHVKIAGFFRSLTAKSMVISKEYADKHDIPYSISSIYTDRTPNDIEKSELISSIQAKSVTMKTFDKFMELMNKMVIVLIVAAVILAAVVLYNLGEMSYIERYRELATLKVVGFKDKIISGLLITQNMWITLFGIVIGIPAGKWVLLILVNTLGDDYEIRVTVNFLSYLLSIGITAGVSLLIAYLIANKNKNIDMASSLKSE